MTWLAFARVLIGIVANIVAWAKDKQLLEAGAALEIARNMEASSALLDKARRARDAAGSDFDAGVRNPDDYRD